MSAPETGYRREHGVFMRCYLEVTQYNMADGSESGATCHMSMPNSLLTTHNFIMGIAVSVRRYLYIESTHPMLQITHSRYA